MPLFGFMKPPSSDAVASDTPPKEAAAEAEAAEAAASLRGTAWSSHASFPPGPPSSHASFRTTCGALSNRTTGSRQTSTQSDPVSNRTAGSAPPSQLSNRTTGSRPPSQSGPLSDRTAGSRQTSCCDPLSNGTETADSSSSCSPTFLVLVHALQAAPGVPGTLAAALRANGVAPTTLAPSAAPTVEPSPSLRRANLSPPPKRPAQPESASAPRATTAYQATPTTLPSCGRGGARAESQTTAAAVAQVEAAAAPGRGCCRRGLCLGVDLCCRLCLRSSHRALQADLCSGHPDRVCLLTQKICICICFLR